MTRLEGLPHWPARMTAPVAAAYMGVSVNTFLERFGSMAVKEGRNTLWAKAQLDAYVASQFGLGSDALPPPADPFDQWRNSKGQGK